MYDSKYSKLDKFLNFYGIHPIKRFMTKSMIQVKISK